jgi:hypothetical protein
MENPDTGQANLSENKSRVGPLWSWILATVFFPLSPLAGRGSG